MTGFPRHHFYFASRTVSYKISFPNAELQANFFAKVITKSSKQVEDKNAKNDAVAVVTKVPTLSKVVYNKLRFFFRFALYC